MRSDVCYYFPTDVASLFNAYATAATQPPFERECQCEPYHTLSFGLSMSLKYNMNGGTCILHFIPLPDGAAVDVHFVIAQAFGARFEAYAEDLTAAAATVLGLQPQKARIDVDVFTQPQYRVTAPVAPAAPAPAPAAQPAPTAVCAHCGAPLAAGWRFCSGCGAPVNPTCPGCGAPTLPGAHFCTHCGTKL